MGLFNKISGLLGRIVKTGKKVLLPLAEIAAVAGAPIGGAIGSIIPGIGTAAGTAAGTAIQTGANKLLNFLK